MRNQKQLRVLMQNRDPDWWWGGDMQKLTNFRDYLMAQGHLVDFHFDPTLDVRQYDVVHLHNINYKWSYFQGLNAWAQNVPFVVSTIFFPEVGDVEKRAWLIEHASKLIVFSKKEYLALMLGTYADSGTDGLVQKKIEEHQYKVRILPNGVESWFANHENLDWNEREYDVICIGPISERKNQFGLLQGVEYMEKRRHRPARVLIIGRMHHGDCFMKMREVKTHIPWEYKESVPHEEMPLWYGRSKVVCQPSLSDPAPNTILEGGMAGCRLLLSTRSYMPELPGLHWCDPNPEDIGDMLKFAIEQGPPEKTLRDILETEYSWPKRAEELAQIYRDAITTQRNDQYNYPQS